MAKPRRKYIERIFEVNYNLEFFTFDGGLFVDFTDKTNVSSGCYYSFSQTETDWISAIKLVSLIKSAMEREANERTREAQEH
jgi:hypothetical protein